MGTAQQEDALRPRFRGALLGVAIGDAIGAGFEGSRSVSEARLRLVTESREPLRYTDDTHMTIGLAESILERGGLEEANAAAVFAKNYAREPWRGYGAGPPSIFHQMERGVPWDEAAASLYGGSGSFGNGAAMRVAPAALFAWRDLERVTELARRSAAITHTHPEGIDGAVLQACAIALLIQQPQTEKLERSRILLGVAPYLRTRAYLDILQKLVAMPVGMSPLDAARNLGNGIEAIRSVPLALYAFLENSSRFPDCVKYAVRAGGDTDTIASMAGALSGAWLGCDAIPRQWIDRLEAADYVQRLADQLLTVAHTGNGP